MLNTSIRNINDRWIYPLYITVACALSVLLNIVHVEWILGISLSGTLFITPLITGIFFGFLLARIKILNIRLGHLATTDALTQLCNRMQFETCLQHEIEKVKRYDGTFSLIFFDVDNFKAVNDLYGHQYGDRVLHTLATKIKSLKRKSDVFARYGGDEFIILTPFTTLQSAQKQARSLQRAIHTIDFDILPGISCSFGVVEYTQNHNTIGSLMNEVDKALYQAKHMGKNCVVAA